MYKTELQQQNRQKSRTFCNNNHVRSRRREDETINNNNNNNMNEENIEELPVAHAVIIPNRCNVGHYHTTTDIECGNNNDDRIEEVSHMYSRGRFSCRYLFGCFIMPIILIIGVVVNVKMYMSYNNIKEKTVISPSSSSVLHENNNNNSNKEDDDLFSIMINDKNDTINEQTQTQNEDHYDLTTFTLSPSFKPSTSFPYSSSISNNIPTSAPTTRRSIESSTPPKIQTVSSLSPSPQTSTKISLSSSSTPSFSSPSTSSIAINVTNNNNDNENIQNNQTNTTIISITREKIKGNSSSTTTITTAHRNPNKEQPEKDSSLLLSSYEIIHFMLCHFTSVFEKMKNTLYEIYTGLFLQ